MKLKINGFESEFDFDEEHVNVLVVKQPKCFANIIGKINEKITGNENNEILFLDDNDNEIKSNRIFMIIDLFNIEYNSKKVLNKIYEMIAQNVEKNQDIEIADMMVKLRHKIIDEINELPFEFMMKDDIDIEELLKLYSLKIDISNYQNIIEKIEFLIDLTKTLEIADLIIIPNLKMYLSDEEAVELYKYSLYNNTRLLIIERQDTEMLKYEKKMIIDENFYDTIRV